MPSRRIVVVTLVVLLAGLALAVRVGGLDRRDGSLSTDEARMALAAEGILRTGLPILPSGRLYTRGLVTAYLTAPSLAIFGTHDWSARLPAAIIGALLVPAVFLLGRAVAGTGAALAAAALVVVSAPLVAWSRQAWPPMTFLLLYTLAAYAAYRGFARDERRWQPRAALLFLATLLAYELALLLPVGVGLYLAGRSLRGDLNWWRGRPTLAALGICAGSLMLFVALGLALRAGTLAGADAELRHYFTPALGLSGVSYYVRRVWGGALPLLLLVPAGLLWCRLARRPLPPGLGYLLALLAPALLVPTFVIQAKQEDQYGLVVVPLLALLGAWGVAALARARAGTWDAHGGDGPHPPSRREWKAGPHLPTSLEREAGPHLPTSLEREAGPHLPTSLEQEVGPHPPSPHLPLAGEGGAGAPHSPCRRVGEAAPHPPCHPERSEPASGVEGSHCPTCTQDCEILRYAQDDMLGEGSQALRIQADRDDASGLPRARARARERGPGGAGETSSSGGPGGAGETSSSGGPGGAGGLPSRSGRRIDIRTALFAVVAFAVVMRTDVMAALQPRPQPTAPTWLDDLRARGWQPDDLVLAEAPLETQLYLGRADFYVHPEGFERYAYQDGAVRRSLYTPAILLSSAGDFERWVGGPHAGRVLWIIGQDDRLPRLTRQMDPALWSRLQAASGVSRPTRGWWIMRVVLPV